MTTHRITSKPRKGDLLIYARDGRALRVTSIEGSIMHFAWVDGGESSLIIVGRDGDWNPNLHEIDSDHSQVEPVFARILNSFVKSRA